MRSETDSGGVTGGAGFSYEFRVLSVVETRQFSFGGLTSFQPVQACWLTQWPASLASMGKKEE